MEPEWRDSLRESAARALAVPVSTLRIESTGGPAEVPDVTQKFVIRDAADAPVAFACRSVEASPDLVARGCAGARLARSRLGAVSGRAVLLPLAEGVWRSLSWALLPWGQPLPGGRLAQPLVRLRLRRSLLDWLRSVTRETRREVEPERHARAVARLAFVGGELGQAAVAASERLARGGLRSVCVLSHGDLWLGNVLLAPHAPERAWARRFLVIDWPGASAEGFAVYDLLRLSASLQLRPKQLRAELLAHAELLECTLEDTRIHLLASLGDLAERLDHFPRERFAELAHGVLSQLERALASSGSGSSGG